MIVTSNRGPDEWLATFADPIRAQAAIDRINANANPQLPKIGEEPYFLTLAPYGFYWFTLVDPETDGMGEEPYGRVEP